MASNLNSDGESSSVEVAEQRMIDQEFKLTRGDVGLIVAFVFCVIVVGAMIIAPLIWAIQSGSLGGWIGLFCYYGVLVLLFVCLSDD